MTAKENKTSKSPLLKAYITIEKLESKLKNLEKKQNEPIAIVGMGCRFPGQSYNPKLFWKLLEQGKEGIGHVSKDRWDVDNLYDPNPDAQGKIYTKHGGYIENIDKFDANFFGITPKEAKKMDPQQRLLLEVSWEALEDAGIVPKNLSETQTGVYVGIEGEDYFQLQVTQMDSQEFDPYTGTGTGVSFPAGRLSYNLGVQGPSMVLATACSSSLVTTHLACQALRLKECDIALSGGVNLMLSPGRDIVLSRMKAIAFDGRCKTFDAMADGYGRGEGCGIIVLKRVSDALKNNDKIYAVIRGSAVNHDGWGGGITVPNGLAQEKLLKKAIVCASVDPLDISYVEAHGTGTALGDPIEVGAINSVLCQNRKKDNPLFIGSVKTNIGHLESGSGVASLIKTALCLKNRKIPPSLNFNNPNPYIDWDDIPIKVPTKLMDWDTGDKKLMAGVSSLGLSGINAHMILEQPPDTISKKQPSTTNTPGHILALSAKNKHSLQMLADTFKHHIKSEKNIHQICFSNNTGRSHFQHRLCVMGNSDQEFSEAFSNIEKNSKNIIKGSIKTNYLPKIAFLFTGQGSQYVNMGYTLYNTQPEFRKILDKCDDILKSYLSSSLLDVLFNDSSDKLLDNTLYTQPALFSLEYALAKVLMSWGIKPSAVLGHSLGEYVAACIAGVFSLEDALKIVATRAKLMQKLCKQGKMLAVFANEEKVLSIIKPFNTQVSVAAINGPRLIVISGESNSIEKIENILNRQNIHNKALNVSHAFHSPLMEPMLKDFETLLSDLSMNSPRISLISNLTGKPVNQEITTPKYWTSHIRKPVRFSQSMQYLFENKYDLFFEIGPEPTLIKMGKQCLSDTSDHKEIVWLSSLKKEQAEWEQMLFSVATSYVKGVDIDWVKFYQDYSIQRVDIPLYQFDRQRYWFETNLDKTQQNITQTSKSSKMFQIKASQYGALENLKPVYCKKPLLGDDEIEIQVKATGINFKDVLQALGMLKDYDHYFGITCASDHVFGFECSGTIKKTGKNISNFKEGDHVIALTKGCLSDCVIAKQEFVIYKPSWLEFEQAATIPLAFLTAYYGLHKLANISKKDKVLIHAATGGVGQAAIQLARNAGAQIFATTSPAKMDYLKSMGITNIMNSRTIDFAKQIMELTQNQGVDIVFNSLTGNAAAKSVEVLAENGKFIEIGKMAIQNKSNDISYLPINSIEQEAISKRPDISYMPFDLTQIVGKEPKLIAQILEKIKDQLEYKTILPLPYKTFAIKDTSNAFQYMAGAKHIGKIVISQSALNQEKVNTKQNTADVTTQNSLINQGISEQDFVTNLLENQIKNMSDLISKQLEVLKYRN